MPRKTSKTSKAPKVVAVNNRAITTAKIVIGSRTVANLFHILDLLRCAAEMSSITYDSSHSRSPIISAILLSMKLIKIDHSKPTVPQVLQIVGSRLKSLSYLFGTIDVSDIQDIPSKMLAKIDEDSDDENPTNESDTPATTDGQYLKATNTLKKWYDAVNDKHTLGFINLLSWADEVECQGIVENRELKITIYNSNKQSAALFLGKAKIFSEQFAETTEMAAE